MRNELNWICGYWTASNVVYPNGGILEIRVVYVRDFAEEPGSARNWLFRRIVRLVLHQ